MNKVLLLLFIIFLSFIFSNVYAKTNERNNQVILSHINDQQTYLCYLEADKVNGWYAERISNNKDLNKAYNRYKHKNGLLIPIFPTVYSPGENYTDDILYYNFILKESGIKKGDKVLVIGSGSGSDTWVAWLKSQTLVYAIDINFLAVANTKATAQIGEFPVEAIQGDIRNMNFPKDFFDFDYVLWNMPVILNCGYEAFKFHDCDDGRILDKFLGLLPQLLKKNGKAIILNTKEAMKKIHCPYKKFLKSNSTYVYLITNN